MVPRKLSLLLFLFFPLATALAQSIEKKLIMTLPDTSSARRYANLSFGSGDDYCYFTGGSGHSWTVMTREKTYGPFLEAEGKGMAWLFYNVKGREQYIKSMTNAPVYGPYEGTVDYASTSRVGGTGYTVSAADSIVYYINGKRIASTDSSTCIGRWCAFSDNGNALYAIKKGDWNYLFINGRLLDSSRYYYDLLDIDDRKNYCYTLGNFEPMGCCSRFQPIPHHDQKVVVPMKKFGHIVWSNSDSLRYYGNGDGITYPSSDLYDETGNKFNMVLLTCGKTIFGYRYSGWQAGDIRAPDSPTVWIWVNGKGRELPYAEITLPCIDSFGHYAFFGRRGYYMYKNVNGVEEKEPLSKYGVRANPISIDVRGNAICYYATEDSVYVYENDRLFRSCTVAQFDYPTNYYGIWSNWYETEGSPVFCVDSNAYIVYNNSISPPLLKIGKNKHTGTFNTGDIIYGYTGEHGYWLLQKTGEQKYGLLINNRRMVLPPGINFEGEMYDDLTYNSKLTANEFIFYAKEGSNIYRYKMKL